MSALLWVLGAVVMAMGTLLALVTSGAMAGGKQAERAAAATQGGVALVALGMAGSGRPGPALEAFVVLVFAMALGTLVTTTLGPEQRESRWGRGLRCCVLLGSSGLPPLPGFWGRVALVVAGLRDGGGLGTAGALLGAVLVVPGVMGAARAVAEVYRAPGDELGAPPLVSGALLVLYLWSGLFPGAILALAAGLAGAVG